MRKTSVLALLLLISGCSELCAQSASAPVPATRITIGQSTVALTGPWKFHIGDNMAWSQPGFDDSTWETVQLLPEHGTLVLPVRGTLVTHGTPGWNAKGHPGYWGYAWYRIHVLVSVPPGKKLAMAGPSFVNDGYQVFANGALLGSFGRFSGHEKDPIVYYGSGARMFLLPETKSSGGDTTIPVPYTLAFRVWMDPSSLGPYSGGLHAPPWLGEASAVAAHVQSVREELIRILALEPIEAALFFLLAIVACSLVLFDRSDPVYLWLAAVLVMTALDRANQGVSNETLLEGHLAFNLIQTVLISTLVLAGWTMVWWVWFRLRRPAWIPNAIAGLTLLLMLCETLGGDFFFTVVPRSVSAAFSIGTVITSLTFGLVLILIAVLGIRQQGREGWVALPAMALLGILRSPINAHRTWFALGIQVSMADITYVALAVVIFILLLRRLLLSLRHQRETALDIKQAQEVQRMLIPKALPQVPGLAIESEYHPASEVGGDFFQILPEEDGSVLIVVGDVSGKGLKAAMTVSTIVGALRAYPLREPAEVLANLNRVLHGEVSGFVTCCATLIASDGAMTLANAGHLSPYCNGAEMAVASGLPLGILAEGNYEKTQYQLSVGDRLTFLSDGVVEATNEKRELFGFERTRQLSIQPAAVIADTAKAFGQQDDITVVTVMRTTNLEVAHHMKKSTC